MRLETSPETQQLMCFNGRVITFSMHGDAMYFSLQDFKTEMTENEWVKKNRIPMTIFSVCKHTQNNR